MAQEKTWVDNRDLYVIKEYPVSGGNCLSIRKFFEDAKYYHRDELAKAARRSIITIDKWAKKSGVREKRKQFAERKTKQAPVKFELVTDPAIWDNREWFYQKYVINKIGYISIARIIGRRPIIVYKRLKKYKITLRKENYKSPNPCCNEEWLMKYYATPADYRRWCQANKRDIDPDGGQCLDQIRCAKLANVRQFTIYNWLIKFNIPIRDCNEARVYSYRKKHGLLKKPLEA